MTEIEIPSNITKIVVDSEVIDVRIDEGSGTLFLNANFSPQIIDSNFREVEMRLNQIEGTIRTQGININKLENKVNVINAINGR